MSSVVESAMVYYEDLDPIGVLHNSKYTVLFERAHLTYWAREGWPFDPATAAATGFVYMVKASSLTYHAPISRTGPVHVRMWIDRIGNTSLTYGFQVLSEDETVLHADGSRVFVHIDPATARSAPIPEDQRAAVKPLVAD